MRAVPALRDFLQHKAISRAVGNPSLAATAQGAFELPPFATQQQSRTIQDLGKNNIFFLDFRSITSSVRDTQEQTSCDSLNFPTLLPSARSHQHYPIRYGVEQAERSPGEKIVFALPNATVTRFAHNCAVSHSKPGKQVVQPHTNGYNNNSYPTVRWGRDLVEPGSYFWLVRSGGPTLPPRHCCPE